MASTAAVAVLGVAAVLLLSGLSARARKRPAPPQLIDLSGWSIAELIDHLQARGIDVCAVSSSRSAPIQSSAYLTTGKQTWAELAALPADARQAAPWDGVALCQRVNNPDELRLELSAWDDNAIRAGAVRVPQRQPATGTHPGRADREWGRLSARPVGPAELVRPGFIAQGFPTFG
jgi:hypothetical protein